MKRAFDIVASLILLVVLAAPMLLLAVVIRFALGSPVIFKQRRPGRNEKLFTMYKFRSMTNQTDPDGQILPDEVRLTRFGKLLRASSLDELPELLNVLKGDMSLVGPRPLLEEYLPLYTAAQRKRHRVRPGITGWAQVNGRNAIGWEQKFDLDIWYVDNASIWLDLKILAKTLAKVVVREGISANDHATVEKFQGSEVAFDHGARKSEE